MSLLQNSNAISSGSYNINNSLRFRSSASATFSRTPASSGSTTKGTFSFWIKRGALSTAQQIYHVAGTSGNNSRFFLACNATTDTFSIVGYSSAGALVLELVTTQVFRDPSAWYHMVISVDTTQASSSNRVLFYINGVQVTAFGTSTIPAQNTLLGFTNNTASLIGANQGSTNFLDGYLSEVNFIDGQALTPSSFGETDTTTGVWKPKAYSGTYGTNGFYLKFSDIATTSGSNAGLGKDFSGNANYWTTNNISVTAGTTYDAMIDSPTLTSATVANYAVLNPIATNTVGVATLSNANLNFSIPNTYTAIGTMSASSGKYYWEAVATSSPIGIGLKQVNVLDRYSNTIYYMGSSLSGTGEKYVNGTGSAYGASWTTGDVIGVAVDMNGGTVTFYKNNASQGSIALSLATITEFVPSFVSGAGATFDGYVNFGQRPFTYTPPSGFLALNTFNLPTPTILQGNKYMDATLWTGTGATLSITNAGAFKPDLVWAKTRSAISSNLLYDSIRGVNKYLSSNQTAAEATLANSLTAFNSNGFTVGSDSNINGSGVTNVGWQWQAGQGSTSSNTSGSITSTVSVNTTAGFSVVTFTKTGTATVKTVGHGLGVAPSMIIAKVRNGVDNWPVYHISNGATFYQELNTTIAKTSADPWGNTTPTPSVFSIKDNGSDNHVAYCWAEIAGFSKFGSYTGNGSADGVFVYLGFRPKFIITKVYSTSGYNWNMYDSSRGTYNAADQVLLANTSAVEETGFDPIDFLSNGFKLRMGNRGSNVTGVSYIYMAFAESPFKNSLAR